MKARSGCPIDLATELLGDRCGLVVLRNVILGDRRTIRDFLNNSLEGIANNILSNPHDGPPISARLHAAYEAVIRGTTPPKT